jgi:integrase
MRLVWFRERWHAYEHNRGKGRKRISLRTTNRDLALQRLADLEAACRSKAATVAELYDVYLAERGPQIASPETLRIAWRWLAPTFGPLRPDQITRLLTRNYATQEQRRRGVGNGTIRRELGVLSAIIRHSNKQSPAVVELPPAPSPRSRHLTREQVRSLVEATRSTPHLHTFVVLAYRTGARSAAVLGLTWDRVDTGRGLIHLGVACPRGKGRAIVPITADTMEILRQARGVALTPYVIEYGGQRVLSVKRSFKAAARRAGLEPSTSPHILRHSAAVHMAESGVPIAEIAQFLGHSSEAVTFRVYARYSPTYLRRAAAVLE